MIKKVYTAILISLLAASCTKGVVEPGGGDPRDNAINFTTEELSADWASKSSTRGAVVEDINAVPSIMAYAFVTDGAEAPYINNQEATIKAGIWGFNPAQYYPLYETLDFLTYTPKVSADNGLTQTLDLENKAVKFTYNLPIADANQPDFMVGDPKTGHSATNKLVTIDFKHALTQLTMSAKVSSGTENNRYSITGFTLHDITTGAEMTYSVADGMGDWAETASGNFIASDFAGVKLNSSNYTPVMATGKALFMIPQEITGAATIKISIKDNEEGLTYRTQAITLPAPSGKTAWESGKHIDLQFAFDVSDENLVIAMTLVAKLQPWTVVNVNTDIDANIYAYLSEKSVPAGSTTPLTLYTNGEVVGDVEFDGTIISNAVRTDKTITVTAAQAGEGSITVVINNSQGKTITKTFNITVK